MAAQECQPLAVRLQKGSNFLRYLYIKPHKGDVKAAPNNSSLFVAGLPVKLGEEEQLRELFSVFGAVKQIGVHPSKKSAIVVFEKATSRDGALLAAAKGQVIECFVPTTGRVRGLKAWLKEYKAERPGNFKLQQQIDDWMINFEKEEEEKKRAREEDLNQDGWTTVKRKKSGKKTSDGTVSVAAVSKKAAEHVMKKTKMKILDNFYRFQAKEKKHQEILNLQIRFEEDRRRIAEMRRSRRFKPA